MRNKLVDYFIRRSLKQRVLHEQYIHQHGALDLDPYTACQDRICTDARSAADDILGIVAHVDTDDLHERLTKAAESLTSLATTESSSRAIHLAGKAEGVRLALSYLNDMRRTT